MPHSPSQPIAIEAATRNLHLQHPLLLPLHLSTLIITLIIPPFPWRRELSAALIIATYIPTVLTPVSPDPPINYAVASLWTFTLRVLTIHLFSWPNPEAVLYRVGVTAKENGDSEAWRNVYDKSEKEVGKAREYPTTYGVGLKKLEWISSLLISPRGPGWSYQILSVNPSILPQTHLTRRTYAIHLLKRLAAIYLLLDVARTFYYMNPTRYILESGSSAPTGVMESIIATILNGALSWGFIELQYLLMSVPGIWILGQHPSQWPPLFGTVGECYTVANLWGRGWHQLLRTTLLPWGDFVSSAINFKSKEAKASVRVIVVFTLSGLGHASVVYVGSRGRFGRESILFFTLQALGILIERLALNRWLWLRQGALGEREKWWGRCFGFIWVLGWLSWTSVYQTGDMRRLGLAREDPVPWSFIRWGLGWPQKFGGV